MNTHIHTTHIIVVASHIYVDAIKYFFLHLTENPTMAEKSRDAVADMIDENGEIVSYLHNYV